MTELKTSEQPQRGITIEDVHKILGASYLEIELLRRENLRLRQELDALKNGTRQEPVKG